MNLKKGVLICLLPGTPLILLLLWILNKRGNSKNNGDKNENE